MGIRKKKVAGRLQEIISTFLNKESSTQSVVTVTSCDVSSDLKNVTAYLTVFPESFEAEALEFAKRKRSELRSLFADKMPMKVIPFVEFEIDAGEKNRQRIDQIFEKI
ncbi:MAG: ribosome-binding factor A [Candidatus Vogelbacteria bacterium]|nr:ribosome-binding factor A [Candidatus Vogelbacteria bacterium]